MRTEQSSEYFTRISLCLVRLKIFKRVKIDRKHLRQIQGNLAGRNFECEFTAHYARKNADMNLKSTTTNGFNFRIINSFMSWGYA